MIRDAILIVLSIALGAIISRLINHHEIHSLKDQLFESENNNEKIVRDNANLVRENSALQSKIAELSSPLGKNTPDFEDW